MARVDTTRIEGFMYSALKDVLEGIVAGGVYRFNCRPRNSRQEDAVIVCSSASAEQIQEGFGRINIYVPDIPSEETGTNQPNIERLEELNGYAEMFVDELNKADTEYLFDLDGAPAIVQETELGQHFANINLKFNKITF